MEDTLTTRFMCPECGELFETEIHYSIDLDKNPEYLSKILRYKTLEITCPHCGCAMNYWHPLTVGNPNKKYSVIFNKYSDLLDFQSKLLVKDENITICGVTNLGDLLNCVLALENGLDWRVVKMMLLYEGYYFLKLTMEDNDPYQHIDSVELGLNDNNKLCVGVWASTNDKKSQYFEGKFRQDVYDLCLQRYKERLDKLNFFVFDDNVRDYFCWTYNEDFDLLVEHKSPYYFVVDEHGDKHICGSYQDNVDVGDNVVVKVALDSDDYFEGEVVNIVYYSQLQLCVPKEEGGIIVSKQDYESESGGGFYEH